MNRHVLTLLLTIGMLSIAVQADDPGSVLVRTQLPQRGAMPDVVYAYGTAIPTISGAMTLSVQAEGRIGRILATPGEAVKGGQSLLEFHLSAAAANIYQQALSALRLAKEEQARTARLLSQQLATRDQQAQADKAVSDAQANLAALEQESGGRPQQMVRAPFDGVVSAISVAQGDRLQPGVPLVTVTRRGGLVVTVGIEPAARIRIKVGQPVNLHPLADSGPVVVGSVARIDHMLNPKTRMVDVDIVTSGDLLQGAAFRAAVRTGELSGWLVPRDAVLDDGSGDTVYQVRDGKAVRVSVKRLGGDNETYVVDGRLEPSLPVVTTGNYQLSDGANVREAGASATPIGNDKSGP